MENPFEAINTKLDIIIQHMDKLLFPAPQPTQERKEWMSLDELVEYLPGKPAKGTIYDKVYKRKIPHYKEAKRLMFRTSEIDQWLMARKVKTDEELEIEAATYLSTVKLKRKRRT